MTRRTGSFLALALALAAPALGSARAHDTWSNGEPVPAWIKKYCCGPQDVHHYRRSEVKAAPEGWVLPDYPRPIHYNDPGNRISQDGDFWAFFRVYPNGQLSPLYCFFVPPQGS